MVELRFSLTFVFAVHSNFSYGFTKLYYDSMTLKDSGHFSQELTKIVVIA